MLRLLFTIISICLMLPVFAQKQNDSLWIVVKNDKWYVEHTVAKGDDIFALALRYHVPPATLADANAINYQTILKPGSDLLIPLGNYNRINFTPTSQGNKKLYYRVSAQDNLQYISQRAGVQQKVMQQWNNMADNSIAPGDVLFTGWMLYEKPGAAIPPPSQLQANLPQQGKKKSTDTYIVIKKTPVDTFTAEERLYMEQTHNETAVTEEKGSAVFFGNSGKIKGTDMYYAFHNTAPKGTIIKVYNPGADKTIYVKVLSVIPGTKQYHNSIIGISGGAREELGALEDKTWCELKYAP